MHQEKRLPQNGKEGFLYGAIICTLTVILMVSFNAIYFAGTFNKEIALAILKVIPIAWVIVMVLEPAVIGRLAEALTAKFTEPTDSFNSKILFRILFTVLGMSIVMTFIGDILSNGFHAEFFSNWLRNWPRNFAVALIAENIMIQPLARFVMIKLHEAQDRKALAANAQMQ